MRIKFFATCRLPIGDEVVEPGECVALDLGTGRAVKVVGLMYDPGLYLNLMMEGRLEPADISPLDAAAALAPTPAVPPADRPALRLLPLRA